MQARCKKCISKAGLIWRANNLEQWKITDTAWKKNNSDRIKAIHHKNNRTVKTRFRHAQNIARRRKLEWSIGFEEFKALCKLECYYCNGYFGKVETCIGLDRIDNSLGYDLHNVQPCCETCNKVKSNSFTVEETKVAIQAIVNLRTGDK